MKYIKSHESKDRNGSENKETYRIPDIVVIRHSLYDKSFQGNKQDRISTERMKLFEIKKKGTN